MHFSKQPSVLIASYYRDCLAPSPARTLPTGAHLPCAMRPLPPCTLPTLRFTTSEHHRLAPSLHRSSGKMASPTPSTSMSNNADENPDDNLTSPTPTTSISNSADENPTSPTPTTSISDNADGNPDENKSFKLLTELEQSAYKKKFIQKTYAPIKKI